MRHEIRVIFGDTDQMGVVYYANYLRYFESARAAYWRALGKSYKDLEDWGVALPVVEAHCNYKRPARYEDLLEVDVEVSELRGASLRFALPRAARRRPARRGLHPPRRDRHRRAAPGAAARAARGDPGVDPR